MRGVLLLVALLGATCLASDAYIYYVTFDGFPLYGVPSGTFPSWYERATVSWFNLVRHGSTSFGTDYLKSITSDGTYSKVFTGTSWKQPRALRWNLNLNRETRAHVTEIGSNSSCSTSGDWSQDCANSTTWSNRVSRFYYWDQYLYELSFAWTTGPDVRWPFYLVAAWMCDGSSTIDTSSKALTLSGCVADSSASSRNVTLSHYGEVGCGMYTTSAKGLVTCDFATGTDASVSSDGNMYPRSQSPIASGAHVTTSSNTTYFFIASYDYDVAISTATVYVNGTAVAMTLKYGNSTSGTWVTSTTYSASGACKPYYFKFGNYYYPTSGVFYTWGMGSCTSDYGTTGGAPSCNLTLPSSASAWGNCSSTVTNTKTCSLTCKSGYTTVSGTCNAGTWSATPSCTPSPCTLTLPTTGADAWGTCNSTVSSGTSCKFTCSSGYTAQTGSCSLGSWNSTPTCNANPCTTSLVTGATGYGSCGASVASDTSCVLNCSSSYTAVEGYCLTGSWSKTPNCTLNAVSSSIPVKGETSDSATDSGLVASSVSPAETGSQESSYTPGVVDASSTTAVTVVSSVDTTTSTGGNTDASSDTDTATTVSSSKTGAGNTDTSSASISPGGGSTSTGNCTLTLVSSATGWGTCSPSVKNATTCSFTCGSKYTSTTGKCLNSFWVQAPACEKQASAATTAVVSAVIYLVSLLLM